MALEGQAEEIDIVFMLSIVCSLQTCVWSQKHWAGGRSVFEVIYGPYHYEGIHSVVNNMLAGHMDIFEPRCKVINLNTSGTTLFGTG